MPKELTPAMIDECCDRIARNGEWPQRVLVHLGASGPQAARWLARGLDIQREEIEPRPNTHDEHCLSLVAGVDWAEAEVEKLWLANRRRCFEKCEAEGKGTAWTGWMTALERRFPDRYKRVEAKRQEAEVSFDQLVRSKSASKTQ